MIREFYIECNGEQIATASFTNKSDTCVIFMNGFSHSKSDFDYFYTDIAKKLYRDQLACSYLFDYIGHGDSSGGLNEATIKWQTDSLSAVIETVAYEMKQSKIVIVGLGIAGLVLHNLFINNYPDIQKVVKKIILISPAIDYPKKLIFENCSGNFVPSQFVSHEKYHLYNDYNHPIILWLANIGCHIENILGMQIRYDLLIDINNGICEIDYRSFPVDTIILQHQIDPRLLETREQFYENTVFINGDGVLPLTPMGKDEIYEKLLINI